LLWDHFAYWCLWFGMLYFFGCAWLVQFEFLFWRLFTHGWIRFFLLDSVLDHLDHGWFL
jgi:hypothetical protein